MAKSRLKPLLVTIPVGYAIAAAGGIPLLIVAESATQVPGNLLVLLVLSVFAVGGFVVGTWGVFAYEVMELR